MKPHAVVRRFLWDDHLNRYHEVCDAPLCSCSESVRLVIRAVRDKKICIVCAHEGDTPPDRQFILCIYCTLLGLQRGEKGEFHNSAKN